MAGLKRKNFMATESTEEHGKIKSINKNYSANHRGIEKTDSLYASCIEDKAGSRTLIIYTF
jgi:hypothetical protein